MSIEFSDWTQSLTQIANPTGTEIFVVVKDGAPRSVIIDTAVVSTQWQKAVAGSQVVNTEADNDTNPTNWVNVLTSATPVLAAGEFEYNAQAVWSIDTVGRQSFFRFGIDGSYSPILRREAENTNDRLVTQLKMLGPLSTASTHTMTVDALIEAGGGTPNLTVESVLVTLERKRGV